MVDAGVITVSPKSAMRLTGECGSPVGEEGSEGDGLLVGYREVSVAEPGQGSQHVGEDTSAEASVDLGGAGEQVFFREPGGRLPQRARNPRSQATQRTTAPRLAEKPSTLTHSQATHPQYRSCEPTTPPRRPTAAPPAPTRYAPKQVEPIHPTDPPAARHRHTPECPQVALLVTQPHTPAPAPTETQDQTPAPDLTNSDATAKPPSRTPDPDPTAEDDQVPTPTDHEHPPARRTPPWAQLSTRSQHDQATEPPSPSSATSDRSRTPTTSAATYQPDAPTHPDSTPQQHAPAPTTQPSPPTHHPQVSK